MIQDRSLVTIADNTGAKIGRIFKIPGSSKKRYAQIGEVVILSVQTAEPRKSVKKKDVLTGVVVRQRQPFRRKDGSYIWVEASLTWSHDPATGAAEIVSVVRDASERIGYETALRQALTVEGWTEEQKHQLSACLLQIDQQSLRAADPLLLGNARKWMTAAQAHDEPSRPRLVQQLRAVASNTLCGVIIKDALKLWNLIDEFERSLPTLHSGERAEKWPIIDFRLGHKRHRPDRRKNRDIHPTGMIRHHQDAAAGRLAEHFDADAEQPANELEIAIRQ